MESRCAAEVSVCFTQRHTLLRLPQELSTLTIPITPRPPETAVFITELLFCACNKVSSFQTHSCNESQTERERSVEWRVDEVSWLLAMGMPLFTAAPHPFVISQSPLHVGAEGQRLLGEGLQREQNLTQGYSNHTKMRGGVGGFSPNSSALFIHLRYLGNVTGSMRNTQTLMCCVNPYNNRQNNWLTNEDDERVLKTCTWTTAQLAVNVFCLISSWPHPINGCQDLWTVFKTFFCLIPAIWGIKS